MRRCKWMIALSVLLIISLWGSACWAEEPATPQIMLNEAVGMALKNSKSLQKSALEVDKTKEEREEAQDGVYYTPGSSSTDASGSKAWYGLMTADLTWQISKRSYAAAEDRLVLDTCQKYWNVQKALANVKSKEMSASVAELAQRRVQAMIRLGMTPPEYTGMSPEAALTAAGGALAKAKSDLTGAQNELNSAYEALNQLLGLWPEDRPVPADEVKYEPMRDVVIESEVNRVLAESPTVWQTEESVNLAKYAQQIAFATGSYSSYEVRKIKEEQAELDALSTKDAVKLATRGFYYSVRNLEAGIPAAEKALAGAEEALRVAKLQYELGMITKENLVKSESALADAKKALQDLVRQHAYMKLAFQKPWAVSSGSSSGS